MLWPYTPYYHSLSGKIVQVSKKSPIYVPFLNIKTWRIVDNLSSTT